MNGKVYGVIAGLGAAAIIFGAAAPMPKYSPGIPAIMRQMQQLKPHRGPSVQPVATISTTTPVEPQTTKKINDEDRSIALLPKITLTDQPSLQQKFVAIFQELNRHKIVPTQKFDLSIAVTKIVLETAADVYKAKPSYLSPEQISLFAYQLEQKRHLEDFLKTQIFVIESGDIYREKKRLVDADQINIIARDLEEKQQIYDLIKAQLFTLNSSAIYKEKQLIITSDQIDIIANRIEQKERIKDFLRVQAFVMDSSGVYKSRELLISPEQINAIANQLEQKQKVQDFLEIQVFVMNSSGIYKEKELLISANQIDAIAIRLEQRRQIQDFLKIQAFVINNNGIYQKKELLIAPEQIHIIANNLEQQQQIRDFLRVQAFVIDSNGVYKKKELLINPKQIQAIASRLEEKQQVKDFLKAQAFVINSSNIYKKKELLIAPKQIYAIASRLEQKQQIRDFLKAQAFVINSSSIYKRKKPLINPTKIDTIVSRLEQKQQLHDFFKTQGFVIDNSGIYKKQAIDDEIAMGEPLFEKPEQLDYSSLFETTLNPFDDHGLSVASITTFTERTPYDMPSRLYAKAESNATVTIPGTNGALPTPQEEQSENINITAIPEEDGEDVDINVNPEEFYLNPNFVHVILEPVHRATLSAQITSSVVSVEKKMGQSFKAGELLIKLDDTIFEANLKKAISIFKQSKLNSDMRRQLFEDDIGSLTELKDAEAKTATALADLAVARKQLEACTIVAPYPGRVVDVRVQEYELALANQPLIDIIGDAILIGKILVDATQLPNIAIGDVVRIYFESVNITVPAKIIRIGAEIDPASSTVRVDTYIENKALALTAGMTGIAVIKDKKKPEQEQPTEEPKGSRSTQQIPWHPLQGPTMQLSPTFSKLDP